MFNLLALCSFIFDQKSIESIRDSLAEELVKLTSQVGIDWSSAILLSH